MSGQKMYEIMKNYARSEMQDPKCELSAVQWVSLLNCYAKQKPASICAKEVGIDVTRAAYWYYRIAMALTMEALYTAEVY